MYSSYFAIGEGGRVEACRLLRVLVEPEADRILWLHIVVVLALSCIAGEPLQAIVLALSATRVRCLLECCFCNPRMAHRTVGRSVGLVHVGALARTVQK